jgi:hypothetical protein
MSVRLMRTHSPAALALGLCVAVWFPRWRSVCPGPRAWCDPWLAESAASRRWVALAGCFGGSTSTRASSSVSYSCIRRPLISIRDVALRPKRCAALSLRSPARTAASHAAYARSADKWSLLGTYMN